MRARRWHFATSYGPGRYGPDFCLWCSAETCQAHHLCPCCRSRWVRTKRRLWLALVYPPMRLWRRMTERLDDWEDDDERPAHEARRCGVRHQRTDPDCTYRWLWTINTRPWYIPRWYERRARGRACGICRAHQMADWADWLGEWGGRKA